ncbi:tRNA/rRNA methyltransferase family protein [Perilla frutescens var. hirtella]|uniref:tRNA/rRNA methyltransferase family protein n=1 Tax=Perilla frutescens var. hirtella TaxID=608512 RepID=A0AAD4JAT6_PERFH|nr:tRNA/rRNA methyltransferase family protein [Perilla frutescens var. hirtella]
MLRHFSVSILPRPGMRTNSHMPLSISRSFGSATRAIASNISDCAEGNVGHSVNLETPQDLCEDRVEELLIKNRDDISRLMKMERRLENGDEFSDVERRERWFPYLDQCKVEDAYLSSSEVLEAMNPFIMDARKEKFSNTVNNRSYSVCLVVEGLTDFGNVSAAFRSADALGIQSVHVVSPDSSRRYRDNRHVSMGAEKWLDIELWNSISECFGVLKARGYRIATTHLGMDAVSVYDVDWSCPTAIVVGNELHGISDQALELSDLHCCIPMRGMVDSFNVSVAAGLLMHQAVCDRISRMGCHGDLTTDERQILLAEFYLRHNKNSTRIANEFSKRKLLSMQSKL